MGLFKKLVRLGVDAVALPVAAVRDATLIEAFLTDKDPGDITADAARRLKRSAEDAYDELGED